MSIKIRYFASLKERLGRSDDNFNEAGFTAAEIWQTLTGQSLPDNVLIAVNMEYADKDYIVQDGDELAFFPPVTGG